MNNELKPAAIIFMPELKAAAMKAGIPIPTGLHREVKPTEHKYKAWDALLVKFQGTQVKPEELAAECERLKAEGA